jgi:epsilon-lactone hydrolase
MMGEFPLDVGGDAIEQRAVFEQVMTAQPLPDDVTTTIGSLGRVPTLEITTADTPSGAVLLWFHGGWYTMGSPRAGAALSSDVARRTGARVVRLTTGSLPSTHIPRRCRTLAPPIVPCSTAASVRRTSR